MTSFYVVEMAANLSGNVKSRELSLPSSRIKTIMKSSPNVENIGQDSLLLVTKATELFIQHLSRQALKQVDGKAEFIDYKHLAEVVQTNKRLDFLKEIIPRKIKVQDYYDMMSGEDDSDSDEMDAFIMK
ncbi:chromatin accessibility complex 16kD protein [Ischnura elegans]|uniref:chromatin accessibility complex 16kD protein n=1 Tax=Ischnura elegans TaxID=197161 RepID=UPI001ED8AE2C|nr:chromatin accessibility complex 16kD protein [Ischnura elegans]